MSQGGGFGGDYCKNYVVRFEVVRKIVIRGLDRGEEIGETEEGFACKGFGEEVVGVVTFGEVEGRKGFEEI